MPHPYVLIPEFIIGTIITLTNIICCVKSLYALKCRETAKKVQTKIKLMCGFLIIVFTIDSVLQLTTGSLTIFCINQNVRLRWEMHHICSGLLLLSYPLGLFSLYYLFGIKLIESFEGSIVQVSKCNKNLFYSSVAIQWICYVVAETIAYIFLQYPENFDMIIYIVLALIVVYNITFIMLLRLFYIQVNACAQTLFSNNVNAQIDLFNISVRQMNCCALALSSSMINMVIYIMAVYFNFYLWTRTIHVIAAISDFTLNSILLMLQYSVCDKEYYQFCGKSDLLCKYCFRNQLIHFKDDQSTI